MAAKHYTVTQGVISRFEAGFVRAGDDECWLWKKSQNGHGYGYFHISGSSHKNTAVRTSSNRAAWIIYKGAIPNGLHVLHKCDVRLCVNPRHLFLGTNLDNILDMLKKGRNNYGERNYNARLTAQQVAEIRREYTGKRGQQVALGKKYGVYYGTIKEIVRGRNWKHLS